MAKIASKVQQKISRVDAQKFLAPVPDGFVFWCNDGRVLHDMRELADGLIHMSDETYAYHSNFEKKDFANWVRDIIKDEALAKELEKPISRAEAAKTVNQRVAVLSANLR